MKCKLQHLEMELYLQHLILIHQGLRACKLLGVQGQARKKWENNFKMDVKFGVIAVAIKEFLVSVQEIKK